MSVYRDDGHSSTTTEIRADPGTSKDLMKITRLPAREDKSLQDLSEYRFPFLEVRLMFRVLWIAFDGIVESETFSEYTDALAKFIVERRKGNRPRLVF